VREPPADLPEQSLRDALTIDYALKASEIGYLPIGHDSHAWAFRADTRDDERYFLKVRRRITNEAGLAIPHFLQERGVARVVAPMETVRGKLYTTAGDYALVVYPFLPGATGLSAGLSESQWFEYGATLRQVHEVVLSAGVRPLLRRDAYVPDGAAAVHAVDRHVDSETFGGFGQASIAGFWRANRGLIRTVVEQAQALGRQVAAAGPPFVLCHADAHTNNVLRDGDEHIWVVDWDETMLAPRERDLMFVMGGIGPGFVTPAQEEVFFRGYGAVDVSQPALAYYRYAWATSDIGSYGEAVFLREDPGALDRQEAVERLQSLFEPGSIVDIALHG